MAHAGGRPLKFQSVGELEQLIDDYIASTPDEELTITGLALALNTTRQTLVDYQEKDEFTDTIKKAKTIIENSYEKSLRRNGRAGDIFGLKNFGWRDKSEVDNTVRLPKPLLDLTEDVLEDDSDQEGN